MKKIHFITLLGLLFLLVACSKDEVPYYEQNNDGIYFAYDDGNSFSRSVNFGDYLRGDSTELSVTLDLKTLGYLTDYDRKLVLKTDTVGDYEKAEVIIPEIILSAGETVIHPILKVKRPPIPDKKYAVKLTVDISNPSNQFGVGVTEKSTYTIYVEDAYRKPEQWGNLESLYGPWTKEKHIFLAKVLNDDHYFTSEATATKNKKAVDSIRTYHRSNPDVPRTIDIPLVSTITNYPKPYYWTTEHDAYMGNYSGTFFSLFCATNNITTATEEQIFQNTSDNLNELNRKAIIVMLNYCNTRFKNGTQPTYFKNTYRVPIKMELIDTYNLVPPACWSDYRPSSSNPNGIFIENFYGAYSLEKYRFMVRVMKTENESANIWDAFPVVDDRTGNLTWLGSDNGATSKSTIQHYHDLFIQEYNKNPGAYNFTFPTTIQFPENSTSNDGK